MKRIWCLALVAVPALAHADGPTDPIQAPSFVTIDRQDAVSRAGLDLTYIFPRNSAPGESTTLLRFDPHGQFIDPVSGFGGYAAMPITYLSESIAGTSTSATGIGDLELGGIYMPHLASRNVSLVLHAGLTLPTGSTGDNEAIANVFGSFSRLNDIYLSIPKGLSLRMGVSPLFRQGQLFARGDFGVDINLSDNDPNSYDTVIRLNFAGGIDLGQVALMAEFTNVHVNANTGTGAGTGANWADTVALAMRIRAGSVQPYVALVLPLDDDSHQVISAALTVGLEGLLRR